MLTQMCVFVCSSPRSKNQSYSQLSRSLNQSSLHTNGTSTTLHSRHKNYSPDSSPRGINSLPILPTPPISPRDQSDSAVHGHDRTRPSSAMGERPSRLFSPTGSERRIPDSGTGSMNAIHSSPTPANEVPQLNLRSVSSASSEDTLGKCTSIVALIKFIH